MIRFNLTLYHPQIIHITAVKITAAIIRRRVILFLALIGCVTDVCRPNEKVELVRNVMAHVEKPDLVFQRNGRVHLNRRGFQFSRLLAADACASAVVMLDRPSSDTVQDCWLPTPFVYFPFTSPPVCHRVPSDSERAILQ